MFHRRLLRVPWAVRRSNQTILKEINPEYSGLMLKLKLQYFGHLMGKTDSLEKTATGEGGDRGWDGWMASLTQWTWVWANSEIMNDGEAWHAAVHGVTKSQTQLSDWTATTLTLRHSHPPVRWIQQVKDHISLDCREEGEGNQVFQSGSIVLAI